MPKEAFCLSANIFYCLASASFATSFPPSANAQLDKHAFLSKANGLEGGGQGGKQRNENRR